MIKTKKKAIYLLLGLFVFICFIYVQNNVLVVTEYHISSEKVPKSFDEYTIVQLSDLHNKTFGKNQRRLVNKVQKTEPDLIVFTGDLVDAKKYDEEPALTLMKNLVKIAPVYYVNGNHEWWSGKFDELEQKLLDLGVHVMRNRTEELTIGNDRIRLIGIDDPANTTREIEMTEENIVKALAEIEGTDVFHILLSHRAELFALYAEHPFDLVFTGHAHGGQFRIPFLGGMVAPNQGLMPPHTAGEHTLNGTKMIVNRGLGNSIIPLRLFNLPEVVVVTLQSE